MIGIWRKVSDGDDLKIPASDYNAFIDAAKAHQSSQREVKREATKETPHPGVVLVRNDSGADVGRFGVLTITGPIFTPTDNAASFKSRVVLKGDVPTDTDTGRFVVTLEPIATGKVGRAYVDGVYPVQVAISDEGHKFADVADGETAHLGSAVSGAAQLLWVEPVEQRTDPAIAWCIVRIGGAPSDSWFWALITGFVAIGANRWGYAFSAVVIDETKAVVVNEDGPSETTEGNYAINMIETNNAATGVQGNSVNQSGLDYPDGYELQPVGGRGSFDSGNPNYNVIGKQVPVQMWQSRDTAGNVVYTFAYENQDDGTCEAAA